MIFFQEYPIYYINLKDRQDRDSYIVNHFSENSVINFNRIEAKTPNDLDSVVKIQAKNFGITENECATTYSHIFAINYFLENSLSEYGIFFEDDVDINNLNKVMFTIDDLFNYFNKNVECIQIGISTREDFPTNFNLRHKTPWDFNCSAYIINKSYAQKLINTYYENKIYSLSKFNPVKILDYRSGNFISTKPVAESIVYDITNTITCPITTFQIMESSINFSDEQYRQNHKSRNDFLNHWNTYGSISLEDLK